MMSDSLEEIADVIFDDGMTEEPCPTGCGKKLRWREKWGKKFLACSGYPKCKEIIRKSQRRKLLAKIARSC